MSDLEAEWKDFSVLGSSYEEQWDLRTNRRRHRPYSANQMTRGRRDFLADEDFNMEDWKPGPAPDRIKTG